MICPIVVEGAAGPKVIGSSFVVALNQRDALLVTAAHNFDWARPPDRSHPSTPQFFRPPQPTEWTREDPVPYIFAFCDNNLAVARVLDVRLHERFDLAVFHARIFEEGPTFQYQIGYDSSLATVGDEVTCLGFRDMKAVALPHATVYDFPLVAREGRILQIEQDSSRTGATVAHVDLAIDSGMSGGPLVRFRNGRPYVCAVAMSDMSLDGGAMAKGGGHGKATTVTALLDIAAPRGWGPATSDGSLNTMRTLRDSGLLRDAGVGEPVSKQ